METDTPTRNRPNNQKKAMVKNAMVTPPNRTHIQTAQNDNRLQVTGLQT